VFWARVLDASSHQGGLESTVDASHLLHLSRIAAWRRTRGSATFRRAYPMQVCIIHLLRLHLLT
jgi:hypothetical protein